VTIFLALLARCDEDETEGANAAVPVDTGPDDFLRLEARLRECADDDTGRCGSAPCPPPPPPKGWRIVPAVTGRCAPERTAEPEAADRDERSVDAVKEERMEADRSATWSSSSPTRCDRCC